MLPYANNFVAKKYGIVMIFISSSCYSVLFYLSVNNLIITILIRLLLKRLSANELFFLISFFFFFKVQIRFLTVICKKNHILTQKLIGVRPVLVYKTMSNSGLKRCSGCETSQHYLLINYTVKEKYTI